MEHIGSVASRVVDNALVTALNRHADAMRHEIAEWDRTRALRHLAAAEVHATAAQRLAHQASKLDEVRHG